MTEPIFRSSPGNAAATRDRPAGARLVCRAAATDEEREACLRIRREVFVAEQGLFGGADADRDDRDSDPATVHVVAIADGVVGGTVRLYPLACPPGRWKGDRLAVRRERRHQGLGAPLVRFAVAEAGARGGQEMEAHIQPANVAFFEQLGWRRAGALTRYAGIPHQRMVIPLVGGGRAADGQVPPGRV